MYLNYITNMRLIKIALMTKLKNKQIKLLLLEPEYYQ